MGKLPETRGELFERAIEVLRVEHRDAKTNGQPARETGLDAAGAAFAGMILTGSEAIVRISAANTAEGELQLADIFCLSGGDTVETMLGTRLFKAEGADRFTYLHRRIGSIWGLDGWRDRQIPRINVGASYHFSTVMGLYPQAFAVSMRGSHWTQLLPKLLSPQILWD